MAPSDRALPALDLDIVDHIFSIVALSGSYRTLSNCCVLSKLLQPLAEKHLYRHLPCMDLRVRPALPISAITVTPASPAYQILETIINRPELAVWVRSLVIQPLAYTVHLSANENRYYALLGQALHHMSKLDQISIANVERRLVHAFPPEWHTLGAALPHNMIQALQQAPISLRHLIVHEIQPKNAWLYLQHILPQFQELESFSFTYTEMPDYIHSFKGGFPHLPQDATFSNLRKFVGEARTFSQLLQITSTIRECTIVDLNGWLCLVKSAQSCATSTLPDHLQRLTYLSVEDENMGDIMSSNASRHLLSHMNRLETLVLPASFSGTFEDFDTLGELGMLKHLIIGTITLASCDTTLPQALRKIHWDWCKPPQKLEDDFVFSYMPTLFATCPHLQTVDVRSISLDFPDVENDRSTGSECRRFQRFTDIVSVVKWEHDTPFVPSDNL